MKYLTKVELEDITKELIENPTREALKALNDKYNSELIEQSVPEVKTAQTTINEAVVESKPIENILETPVMVPTPNITMPITEISNTEFTNQNKIMPSFELPKLETPTINNQNNQPINFNGNIFDTPNTNVMNLMQTTDNFNSVPNIMPKTMPNTEIPVGTAPFFSGNQEVVNNPIPVNGPVNNVPNQVPSMFGQFEKNNM